MVFKLNPKNVGSFASDRIKTVDAHPDKPYVLNTMYNGCVDIFDTSQNQLITTLQVASMPIRTGRFIASKNWVVLGCDDAKIYVFNFNTNERVNSFEAHMDYIRCVAVHADQPLVASCSDDMSIKLWNWEKNWACVRTFQAHSHYIMHLVFNPKDSSLFASASLDGSVKIWSVNTPDSGKPNLTIQAHQDGVNCVDFCHHADKPYIITCSDDRSIKIWDLQTKSCIHHVVECHSSSVSCVAFHFGLNYFFTASEDGHVRGFTVDTFEPVLNLPQNVGRLWSLCCVKDKNKSVLAAAGDTGMVVVNLGVNVVPIDVDTSGKVIKVMSSVRNSEIACYRVAGGGGEKKGEGLTVVPGDFRGFSKLGACDFVVEKIVISGNNRLVGLLSNKEFTVYTTMALRSKCFGKCVMGMFVWSNDGNESKFVVADTAHTLTMYENFAPVKKVTSGHDNVNTSNSTFPFSNLFGGAPFLCSTCSIKEEVVFYSWDDLSILFRVECFPKFISFSSLDNKMLLSNCTSQKSNTGVISVVLSYDQNNSSARVTNKFNENAFSEDEENTNDSVGLFINHPNFYVFIEGQTLYLRSLHNNNEINNKCGVNFELMNNLVEEMTILPNQNVSLTGKIFMIGGSSKNNTLYVYNLKENLIRFVDILYSNYPEINEEQLEKMLFEQLIDHLTTDETAVLTKFLQKAGLYKLAVNLIKNKDELFELFILMDDLDSALGLLQEQTEVDESLWSRLSTSCVKIGRIDLAYICLKKIGDYSSLLFLARMIDDKGTVKLIAGEKNAATNVQYLANFMLGNYGECAEILKNTGDFSLATLMCSTKVHNKNLLKETKDKWMEQVKKFNADMVERIKFD